MKKVYLFIAILVVSTMMFSGNLFFEFGLYNPGNNAISVLNNNFVAGYNMGMFETYITLSGVSGSLNAKMETTKLGAEEDVNFSIGVNLGYGGIGGAFYLIKEPKTELALYGGYNMVFYKKFNIKGSGDIGIGEGNTTSEDNNTSSADETNFIDSLNEQLKKININIIDAGLKIKYRYDNNLSLFAKYGLSLNIFAYKDEMDFEDVKLPYTISLNFGTISFITFGVEFDFGKEEVDWDL
ncbi:hypothetical protein [Marinitoga sp. 1138]|uniref:hypothetical protein n=1 Tax=Marinitoga sp. 1138 TaxID=1643334 RepID=UPI0015869504|nr:hypothetical protein [Marinitoga sp. 1138]NUU97401.1 hypothetical protein [Marinitoga sp. 1138]